MDRYNEDEHAKLKRDLEIETLRFDRNMIFMKRFCYLTVSYMVLMVTGIVAAFVGVFIEYDIWGFLDMYQEVLGWVGCASGYVFAEWARRKSVNPDTEDLRPYTWGELFRRV